VGAGCSDDGLGADHPSKATITTVAGTGEAVLATDGVPATDATFLDPQSVVVDAQGNIFVGDATGHVVYRIDGATGELTIFAGTGAEGVKGDGGPAEQAQIDPPTALRSTRTATCTCPTSSPT